FVRFGSDRCEAVPPSLDLCLALKIRCSVGLPYDRIFCYFSRWLFSLKIKLWNLYLRRIRALFRAAADGGEGDGCFLLFFETKELVNLLVDNAHHESCGEAFRRAYCQEIGCHASSF